MTTDAEKLKQVIEQSVLDGTFRTAVLSKPTQKTLDTPARIDVRPVLIKQQSLLQFTSRVGNQEIHRNFDADEAVKQLVNAVGAEFRDCRICTATDEWMARHSRKGVCSLKQTPSKTSESAVPVDHNKTRQYLIPEGRPVPFLVATGIMNREGKVRAKHYSKFRQINRYVEFIQDVYDHLPAEGVVRVADFGCGKSYLTFATHYLLTNIRNRSVEMVGLDRRADVVGQCSAIVQELQLDGLQFQEGDIADYVPSEQVHLAISLHACDTATDDALAVAADWKTNVILAVPCCQHELAASLERSRVPVMSEHGILHERFASLATDAIRANLMECAGYKTKVLEFIDMEHTPKNLLIRAIRRREGTNESNFQVHNDRMQAFSADLGLSPLRLQQKLEEYGLLKSGSSE